MTKLVLHNRIAPQVAHVQSSGAFLWILHCAVSVWPPLPVLPMLSSTWRSFVHVLGSWLNVSIAYRTRRAVPLKREHAHARIPVIYGSHAAAIAVDVEEAGGASACVLACDEAQAVGILRVNVEREDLAILVDAFGRAVQNIAQLRVLHQKCGVVADLQCPLQKNRRIRPIQRSNRQHAGARLFGPTPTIDCDT